MTCLGPHREVREGERDCEPWVLLLLGSKVGGLGFDRLILY